jgi:hypothetical protein
MRKFFKISFLIITAFTLHSCKTIVSVQEKSLYDNDALSSNGEINGFKATRIFNDDYDNSVWVSPERNCVSLSTEKINIYSGKSGLKVKWDKIAGGCKWIGIGFGWNSWMAKDLLDVSEDCAVQMKVKSANGNFKNFPVAFAFEDYSGVQSYYGFQMNLASGEFNNETWTTVTIPLKNFDFKSKNFDLEKVKQFIIQLEGDGDIYLDDIKIVKL